MVSPVIQDLLQSLDAKKKQLDTYRPFPRELIANLNAWFRIELTYTSNALEGNTLTSSETALIVEKGITVGGKTLWEHLEAINHAEAFDYIVYLAQQSKDEITLTDIYTIHRLILRRIDDDNAGQLRKVLVRISGLDFAFPEPLKLQEHMEEFMRWLHAAKDHPVIVAADAHLKLVTIHPFVDGNGRTARLLLNLLLIQAGYPPALITPQDRTKYIDALAQAQKNNQLDQYYTVIITAIERSLTIYLEHAQSTIK